MVKLQDLQGMIEGHSKRNNKPNAIQAAAGFVAGSIVGATAGLLLAPDKGRETRKKLRQQANKGWGKAETKASQAKDTATSAVKKTTSTTRRNNGRNNRTS